MNLFDLMAKITLDTSDYEEGLGKSEEQAEGFGSKLKSGLGTAAKAGGAALGALATGAVAVGTALVKGASDTAAYGDKIDKMSQKMGISAEAYQEWDAILQHSGSSIDGMQKGMMTLSKAAETGSDAFAKLGLSQEDVASMNQEELFAATIKGLQGMEEGTERTVLAQQLLGGAAKELGPLLNTSAEETEAMRQRVHELGGVMSDEAVKAAAGFQDSLQDMKTSISGIKTSVFSTFMPGISGVMNGLTAIFSGDSESGVGMITEGISGMVDQISEGLPKVIEVASEIMSALLQAITDNLPTIIEQGANILLKLVVGIVEQLPALIEMAPQIVSSLVKAIVAAAPALLQAGMKLLETVVIGIAKAYNKIVAAGKNVIASIKTGISEKFDELKAWLGEKFDTLKEKITGPFEKARDAIKGIVEKIKGFFDFTAKTPKIKLPHIVLDPPDWTIGDLFTKGVPKISIKWYKKAYNNPYMFTEPTVVARGFGDGHGGEIVYGHENLMEDIRAAAGNDEKLDIIIGLLEDIVHNGLSANIDRNQMYKTMASMNRSRNYATGYNGFSGV